LLVNAADRLLLFRYLNRPGKPELGTVWLTPGGGVKDGELIADAAARELREETGLSVAPDQLGPAVAVTSGTADLGWMAGEFRDDFFFLRVPHHEVDIRGFEELEASTFVEHRWWSVGELAKTTERVIPNGLVPLLSDLLTGNRPADPVRLPWHH
jgi:8-oxo-dGTP pyrophosphatase MutT (NUDIX family)